MKYALLALLVIPVGIGVSLYDNGLHFGMPQTASVIDAASPESLRSVNVLIGPGLDRARIAETIGAALGWNKEAQSAFASVHAQMSWDAYKEDLDTLFKNEYTKTEGAHEVFMTNSLSYASPRYDFLRTVYEPGTYILSATSTQAQIASELIEATRKAGGEDMMSYLRTTIDPSVRDSVLLFIDAELDLLPDLVPLPPRDMTVLQKDGRTLLGFSTIYYNQGEGQLELIADPKTQGVKADIERTVFQRITRKDGSFRERESGTFLWHNPHLHYHFADFVIYRLEALSGDTDATLNIAQEKSTFCIRDVSRTSLELANTPDDAGFKICGKERQGISVGWGDTYFYTYPDQNLDISNLASGTYRLTFIVNPSDRLDEVTLENNTSSATFSYDAAKKVIEIQEEYPSEAPEIEHVYRD